jgi:peptidoglycan/LPS O-acetylase OafA/YrhL
MDTRIPSLDGMRAASIGFVLLSHLSLSAPEDLPASSGLHFYLTNAGQLGVRVFFVISGFLITTLLLRELESTGSVSLKSFYMRRAFRIMPVFYAFLLVAFLGSMLGLVSAGAREFLGAATYLANYTRPHWGIGHTWSLAVEEQFYLIWPGLLVFVGTRRAFLTAAAMLLAAPIFRVLSLLGTWPSYWSFAFECVSDALATGCLLAYVRDRLWRFTVYRRLLNSDAILMLPVVIVVCRQIADNNYVWSIAGIPSLNIAVALCVDRYIRFPHSVPGRILNMRAMVWIGWLSYSLYLWQQLFFDYDHPVRFPFNMLCAFTAAIISYYCIETPILELRKRVFGRPRTPAACVPKLPSVGA